MDIEQFKMIIELAEKAGQGAFTIALIYMVMPLVLAIVKYIAVFFIIRTIFTKVVSFFDTISFRGKVKSVLGIRDEFISELDQKSILKALQEAQEEGKIKKRGFQ